MKQNFANLGTRTPDRRQIFAHLYHWARKLLLILGAGTDLPANRESTYNPPLSRGSFCLGPINSGGRFCTQVVRSGLGLSFCCGNSCDHRGLNPGWARSRTLPLPLD